MRFYFDVSGRLSLVAHLCNADILPGYTLQADLSQKHGESDVILVKHASGCSVEHHLQKQIGSITQIPKKKSPCRLEMCVSNLEEVLSEDSESL